MSDLRVSSWKRYGHDRLYVSKPDGTTVAWLDRKSEQLNVLVIEYRGAVLEVLAPYLAPSPEPASDAAATLELSDDEDLAGNRPGEALRERLATVAPPWWQYALLRLLRRRHEADPWRIGLRGKQVVAAELRKFPEDSWRVLHSVPLPREVDIDHLLIGAGGVFCLNTKHHPNASVWVGNDSVKLGRQTYPYVRKSRSEAARVAKVLTEGCGFPVEVEPVLVFVRPAKLSVHPTLRDVRVVRHKELTALGATSGALDPSKVEHIFSAARRRSTWAAA